MVIFLILIALLCLINIKFAKRDEFFIDTLDKSSNQSTCIKGIFALIIILQHARGYLSLTNNFYDSIFTRALNFIGQLMVVLFLFYSGFGIMESYKKNPKYFVKYPYTRIFKVLLHFDLAILLFIILNSILNIKFPISTTLLAFTGYTSIGNSNWYVFSILCAYLLIYIAHFVSKKPWVITLISFILLLGYCIGMSYIKEGWWYNTILTVPLGMLYSVIKDKLYLFLFKNNSNKNYIIYVLSLIALFIGLCWLQRKFDYYCLIYNLYSCVFALLVIAITYKVKISNKALEFFGIHSFSIYITQRLSMISFARTSLVNYPIWYTLVCFIVTIIIAVAFTYLCNYVDKLLFKKRTATHPN